MTKQLLFFLLILLATSCISEGATECPNTLRLSLRYTLNSQNADRIADEVRSISVYIFDSETGVLVDIVQATEADIKRGYRDITLPYSGKYTFTAWGASGTDIRTGGYKSVQMTNAAAHTYTDAQIGSTTLDNFRKMMDLTPATPRTVAERSRSTVAERSRSIGEVTPTNNDFDHLFHANVQAVPVIATGVSITEQTIPLDFMRNTATLRVTVTGLQHVSGIDAVNPIEMFVTAKNGRYNFDNSIGTFAREVIYEQPHKELSATQMLTDIKIQRLVKERHLGTGSDPVLLSLRHPVTGNDIIAPINVVDIISQNPAYATQEQIDRESLFEIELSLSPSDTTDLAVTITINEWVIVDVNPERAP
jgi:hypothetical protein